MKKRSLTPEERDLWRRATRDVTRPKDQTDLIPAPVAERLLASPKKGLLRSTAPKPYRETPKAEALITPSSLKDQTQSAFDSGDPKLDRHARRGRLEIDATLDLHGHTQASARTALSAFVSEARRRGHRCVLVITGKGARISDGVHLGGGIIRQRFKDWMREGVFRDHIVRASPAHPRHGGGGAFYVFLKRRKR